MVTQDGQAGDIRFNRILDELRRLHDLKQQDYGTPADPLRNVRGSTDWGIPAWVGTMVRAQDKIKRLQTLAIKGTLANEKAEDAFLDLAVYAIIGLILFRESVQPKTDWWGSATVAKHGPDSTGKFHGQL